MDWWQAVVLGLVQGLTEFLPVSSSAHLRVVAALLGWPDPGAAFTAVTQLGTETAVLIYFRRDIAAILSAWAVSLRRPARRGDPNARLGWYVIVGTLPIGLLGVAFQDTIETALRDLRIVATTLIVFGLVLGLADRVGRNARPLGELTWRHALVFGFAQALALIPGVSRSGGTISAGLLLGYRRVDAAKYSFLLAIPAVLASGVLELTKIGGADTPRWGPTLLATAIALGVGYAAVAWLLRFISTHTFTGFVIYRVVVGTLILVLVAVGVLPAQDGQAPAALRSPLDWWLFGRPTVVLTVAGALGLVGLLAVFTRRWWTRRVPLAVAAAVAVLVKVVVEQLWRPFPDPIPLPVLGLIAVAVLAVGLALARPAPRPGRRSRRPTLARSLLRRLAVTAAAVLVMVAAAAQANLIYQQYPTLRGLLGLPLPNEVSFAELAGATPDLVVAAPGRSVQQWQPPPGMPSVGAISQVPIPGMVSGFAARPGWLYLPPAYLTTPRAQLPVLVLLAGQPGGPRDWLDGGRLVEVMDRFAAAHAGLAPVVVLPDDLGSALANPLCLDSRLGRAETYLTVDVPAWIRTHLQVNPDPAVWAVGGFSHGGTCALQLAVRAPRVYPSFIDIAGQAEPTLGSRQRTITIAFGGDGATFARINPLDLLATGHYPASGGEVFVGRDDRQYGPEAQRVAAACRGAGMQIHLAEVPGAHTGQVWGPSLEQALPWLGDRTGLTTPAVHRLSR